MTSRPITPAAGDGVLGRQRRERSLRASPGLSSVYPASQCCQHWALCPQRICGRAGDSPRELAVQPPPPGSRPSHPLGGGVKGRPAGIPHPEAHQVRTRVAVFWSPWRTPSLPAGQGQGHGLSRLRSLNEGFQTLLAAARPPFPIRENSGLRGPPSSGSANDKAQSLCGGRGKGERGGRLAACLPGSGGRALPPGSSGSAAGRWSPPPRNLGLHTAAVFDT